ncbi:hypothetical protein BBI17_007681 [Phytophthora kernoviae]|uniref:Uncharacterized protein n=1 Tax=Phytophthora kernoviae TaxID=325452 RepID=A0A421EZS0_9STRA|nr:hypothetical protein BBI17_007681 [Phytophthora kernoviae]
MTTNATAEFSITSGRTKAVASPKNNANFAKKWTLKIGTTNAIDSLDLDLAGRVHIVLASGAVREVKSSRSAQVVIEDGVLVKQSSTGLQIEASGSSTVFVSAAETAVSVHQFALGASGTARIEYKVNSVDVQTRTQVKAKGSSTISLLSSSLKTNKLGLKARGSGMICIDADEVTTKRRSIWGAKSISMPNAPKKHGSTGTFACDESKLPARKPACVSSSCTGSSPSVVTDNGAGTTPGNSASIMLDDDGELDDDINDSTDLD